MEITHMGSQDNYLCLHWLREIDTTRFTCIERVQEGKQSEEQHSALDW